MADDPAAYHSTTGEYALERNGPATMRLNLQHFLHRKVFPALLHPRIPTDSVTLRVADVATGSGIWLLELSDTLAATTQLEGFDIGTPQTPAAGLLPPNVSFSELDIFAATPAHLLGQFDVVHVRHLVLVVRDNDPAPVLRSLLRLLKPGGYLQWSEMLAQQQTPRKAAPGVRTSATAALLEALTPKKEEDMAGKWIAGLEGFFEREGLVEVGAERGVPDRKYALFEQQKMLQTVAEVLPRYPAEKRAVLEGLLAQAEGEAREGAFWEIPQVRVVGRKPV